MTCQLTDGAWRCSAAAAAPALRRDAAVPRRRCLRRRCRRAGCRAVAAFLMAPAGGHCPRWVDTRRSVGDDERALFGGRARGSCTPGRPRNQAVASIRISYTTVVGSSVIGLYFRAGRGDRWVRSPVGAHALPCSSRSRSGCARATSSPPGPSWDLPWSPCRRRLSRRVTRSHRADSDRPRCSPGGN